MEFANRYEVWILHIWTSTGLMNRVSTSDLLSQLHKKDHFSERLLTEYEIWNLYENMNRIRTWSKENRLQLLWSLDFIRRKFFLICNRLTAYSAVQRKYKTSKWNGNLKDFCDRRFLIPLFNPLAEVRNERCWYTSFRRCYAFFMIQKYRFEISIDVKTELTIAKTSLFFLMMKNNYSSFDLLWLLTELFHSSPSLPEVSWNPVSGAASTRSTLQCFYPKLLLIFTEFTFIGGR